MFERMTLHAADLDASQRFYETVLPVLDLDEWREFALVAADGGAVTRGLHLAFAAPSRAHVDAFWQAGIDAGYESDGAPGMRPQYSEDYYGGFLLDPDGNSAEAVHHGDVANRGAIDHLWIRVRDVEEAARFYAEVGARAGFAPGGTAENRRHFRNPTGSFAVVHDERPPAEQVHLTFRTDGKPESLRDPDGNLVELVTA